MKKLILFALLGLSLVGCHKDKVTVPTQNVKEYMSVIIDTSHSVAWFTDSINHSPSTVEVCPKPIENWVYVSGSLYRIDVKLQSYDTLYGNSYKVNYIGTNCTGGIAKCIIIYRGDTMYNNL